MPYRNYVVGALIAGSLFGAPKFSTAETLTVTDNRPVAEALQEFGRRYGWVVNYADPPFADKDDLTDVTNEVAKRPIGHAVLVPRRESLTFNLPAGKQTLLVDAVRDVVRSYNIKRGAEMFTVSLSSNGVTVLPRLVKNAFGKFESLNGIMDTPVTLVAKRRSVEEFIDELCRRVSANGTTKLGYGAGPMNLFSQAQVAFGASNEPARLVLDKVLANVKFPEAAGPLPRFSWYALYAPDQKIYLLNILPVAN